MNELESTLEEIVESLKDGLPVNEVLSSLRDTKLPGCKVEYQSGFVGEGRPSYPHFVIRTSHPKLDYVHYVEYDLLRPMSADDKKELGDHLIVVLNAWLRELRRNPKPLTQPAADIESSEPERKRITRADLAKKSSYQTVKRRIEDGTLPKPHQPDYKKNGFFWFADELQGKLDWLDE